MGSAPSMASQPAAGAEAGVALVPTSEDPEVEEIKRDLSAQLDGAVGALQESAPQFGRGASTFRHAASFGESSGPATVLKAWLGLTHAPFLFVYFSILPTYTYYIYICTHIYTYICIHGYVTLAETSSLQTLGREESLLLRPRHGLRRASASRGPRPRLRRTSGIPKS